MPKAPTPTSEAEISPNSGGPDDPGTPIGHGAPEGATGAGLFLRLGIIPVVIALLGGLAAGLGGFTFGYGEGASYLSNDPAACTNCHIMQEHFDTWQKSSHHQVATCNDCHLSHHKIGKWITKADNGFFHSLAFTTGNYPDPLQIKGRNRRVTQKACLHCHGDFVQNMFPPAPSSDAPTPSAHGADMLNCVQCHADVGHSQRRLSDPQR